MERRPEVFPALSPYRRPIRKVAKNRASAPRPIIELPITEIMSSPTFVYFTLQVAYQQNCCTGATYESHRLVAQRFQGHPTPNPYLTSPTQQPPTAQQ